MTRRALELLRLPDTHPSFILDLGCGSGLSGEILSQGVRGVEEGEGWRPGHVWVGMDIAPFMLEVALERRERGHRREGRRERDEEQNTMEAERESGDDEMELEEDDEEDSDSDSANSVSDPYDSQPHSTRNQSAGGGSGDLFLADMGQGLSFRPGTFDAAISISAVQWLCNAESTTDARPEARLRRFFDGLYACLKRGGKAVLQFYPKNEVQRGMITKAAVRAGFGAGLLVDDEGTKNEKLYLCLSVGGGDITGAVDGMEGVDVDDARRIAKEKSRGKNWVGKKGGKQWVLNKKEKMRAKGKVVKSDSKFTGRKRGPKF